jgi:NADH-quinone oxidoreductase subunit H
MIKAIQDLDRRTPLWVKIVVPLIVLGFVIALVIFNLNAIIAAGEGALNFVFNRDGRTANAEIVQCRLDSACSLTHAILYSAIVLFTVITGFAYTTLLERKYIAWFQHRSGPNRVGPWGLLQPAADGLKLIFKEDIMPAGASKAVWLIAPLLKTVPTLIVIAVIPLGPDLIIPWFDGRWYQVPLGLADPNVGVLWLLAITSIATYGVALAGWASNNKYAMLGGLRASAQMISYELSLGLAMSVPILIVGSMSVGDIIAAQSPSPLHWFVFQNPLAAAILIIALVAEVNRAPFDLPEAEQELTAGFMTEYSGMKFAMFMMAEYLGMIGVSMIAMSLFFGGYSIGFGIVEAVPALAPLVMIIKIVLCLIGFVWIRATLPRIRYDRLMSFGWKVLLPLSLVAVIWTAISVTLAVEFRSTTAYAIFAGVVFVLVLIGGVFAFRSSAQEESAETAEADPVITGERKGVGNALLMVVGGILAIPFGLYAALIGLLRSLQKMGDLPAETPADAETTAIQPVETSAPVQQGGD